jgi:hypothetical protein
VSAVLRICGAGDAYGVFHCPGCERGHTVRVAGEGAWGWNGDVVLPTLTPSVFANAPGPYFTATSPSCHSFVRDGQIQFLNDCTHPLAGQTVPLAPLPESYG